MGTYVPNTRAEQQQMLEACGFTSFEDMYSCIPEKLRLKKPLQLPEGKTELEVVRAAEAAARKNRVYPTVFRGAGAYRHFIPSIVKEVTGKEEFRTAYTPYQAEISQGVLQSIFEFQTGICELTGMAAANASVYDGATAAAEACEMCREKTRRRVLVSATVDPKILSVVRTYSFGRDGEVTVVPEKDGVTDPDALEQLLDDETACFLLQQPNRYGCMEDADQAAAVVHGAKAKLIMSCNPIALAVMKTPGELGADVAVGEGQPLGLPLGFGGPYLGFMATTQKHMRRLPGRIVGETVDSRGGRAYVLSLQAREQHIRREKASSNICSNEALCALTAGLYMATMGPDGMAEVARQCMAKAHYLASKLVEAGCRLEYSGRFFHEFVTRQENCREILGALSDEGILGGLLLPDGESILWCVTEKASKEALDEVADIVKEALA